jgi:cytochrome c oxidase subunit 1
MSVPIASGPRALLLRRWMLFAVSALGIAGGFAFLAVLTRTPAVQILTSAEGLHRAIAGHVTFSLLVWLLAFEAVLWILARGSENDTRLPWLGLSLAVGGSGLLMVAVLSGRGAPILTDYVSVVVDPLFFVGLAGLVCGVGLAAWSCFDRAVSGRGLLQHGMRRAAVVGALALGACLVALLRLAAGTGVQTDFAFFQSLFWVPGHLLQFVNAIAMVSAWYLLLESGFGVTVADSRLARVAFTGYVVFASLLFVAAALADPRALPANLKLSIVMGVAIALPTAIHIGIVVRALIRNRRASASPEAAALVCSLSLFGGGILLAVARAGTGSSMWIPAHYHAVVVGGVTIALMGLTYRVLAETGEIAWPRLATLQPWLYGVGMLLVVVGMNWAGSSGAPRKTFDPALGMAAARWVTPMNLMGLGGVVAVLGGAAFVMNAFWSLLGVPRVASVAVRAAALEAISPSRGAP